MPVTNRGYVPAEGALYSEQGNPNVVMEQEYLELRDVGLGSTRAVFQFRNIAASAVTVECGFPIDFAFTARRITLDGTGKLVASEEDSPPAGAFTAWDFGDVVASRYAVRQAASPRDEGFVNNVLSALSIPTDPWDSKAALAADDDPGLYYAGTYFRDDQYPRGRKELDAASLRRLFGFRIEQDGKEVPVATAVADFGKAPGHLVLHFRHQLSFPAGGRSTVAVTYAMPTRSAVSNELRWRTAPLRTEFTWKYVLETASSWKDSLGRIVLTVPAGLDRDLPQPWKYVGTMQGRQYYTAENWKPGPKQNLSLTWATTMDDDVFFWQHLTEPLDPADLPAAAGPARLLGASSFLTEAADVFLPEGIWHNAPFDAARLFDGLRETAWAVRTPKGGIGEYVRFSVAEQVARLEVANGYQRSTVNFPDKDTWSFFGKNNRVKTLDIVKDSGGMVQQLQLADTREIQMFDLSLPPGTYRAVIADIYRGSRWNDTCLGELTFVRGTATGFAALTRDEFFGPLLK